MDMLPRRTLLAAGAALPLVAIRTRPAGAAEFTAVAAAGPDFQECGDPGRG